MFNIFSFFHLNIMYSSLNLESRKKVLNNCYWPLLKFAEKGFKIGVEAPAITLEIINDLDPNWVHCLSKYIKEEKIEFIGSGYSQVIGPLVPAKLNIMNQRLGINKYKELLGQSPKIALINEMAYSKGIIEHYFDFGYKGLIMEWNNPSYINPNWKNEWRYFPQNVELKNGYNMPIIWADSIIFQKFQRYVHGEIDFKNYIKYIKTLNIPSHGYFPLYSNDVEIFDFRPGRYKTEKKISKSSEWERIIELYEKLKNENFFNFVFPFDVLSGLKNNYAGINVELQSAKMPIPVKKQEKYNINRWALTGRNDIHINSKCFQIYNGFIQSRNDRLRDWEELCFLWSSDFRTHITQQRWNDFKNRLDTLLSKSALSKGNFVNHDKIDFEKCQSKKENIIISNENIYIELVKFKGLNFNKVVFKNICNDPIIGTIEHGFFDDITLAADFHSNHSVIANLGEHKITDLKPDDIFINKNKRIFLSEYEYNGFRIHSSLELMKNSISINKNIYGKKIGKCTIRPLHYTFLPNYWDLDTLNLQVHNGGSNVETFYVKDQNIIHNEIYSELITSRHAFGNTEGVVIVGDKDKSIKFETDMAKCSLIPSLIFKETNNSFLFRLVFSCREVDETLKELNDFSYNIALKISAS
tara:strand:- start:312 stop:2231 length:1920 start_codon:yes stop_codon:yes gene_type:complete